MEVSMNNVNDLLSVSPVNQDHVQQPKEKKDEKKTDFEKKYEEIEGQKTKKPTDKTKKERTDLDVIELMEQMKKNMVVKPEEKVSGNVQGVDGSKAINDVKKMKELKELKEMQNLLTVLKKETTEPEEQTTRIQKLDLEKMAKELKQIPKEALTDLHSAVKESKQATIKLEKTEHQANPTAAVLHQTDTVKQDIVVTKPMTIQDVKEFIQTESSDVKFQVNGSKSITIQLNPEHLGKLEVKLEKLDEGMSIELKFENINSRTELEAAMEEFKEEMKKNDVDLMVNIEWDNKDREQKEKEQQEPAKKSIKEDLENNEAFEDIYEQELKG